MNSHSPVQHFDGMLLDEGLINGLSTKLIPPDQNASPDYHCTSMLSLPLFSTPLSDVLALTGRVLNGSSVGVVYCNAVRSLCGDVISGNDPKWLCCRATNEHAFQTHTSYKSILGAKHFYIKCPKHRQAYCFQLAVDLHKIPTKTSLEETCGKPVVSQHLGCLYWHVYCTRFWHQGGNGLITQEVTQKSLMPHKLKAS